MKRKFILPSLATLALFSLFFIQNIAIDDGVIDTCIPSEKASDINDLGESENSNKSGDAYIDFEDFEDFLFGLGNKPLVYAEKYELDTTGDGKLETVLESVKMIDNKCEVQQEIIKDKKVIWKNVFHFSLNDLSWYFQGLIISPKDQNKALFYLGLTKSRFIIKPLKTALFNDRIKRIARFHFKGSTLSNKEIYSTDFFTSLEYYNGFFVVDRSPGNDNIYMWNDVENQFIEVYTPNKIHPLI